MKIGTDAVLLGAWTPLTSHPYSILDIGAGTGVLALMMAQRSRAEQIDAIEIDENAYEQCVENFEASPWADRLFCFHAGLDELVAEPEESYDLIISNPPFYTEDYKSENSARDLARFEDALPFEELINSVDVLLAEEGIFTVIIPYRETSKFILLCEAVGLYPFKITHIKGNPTADFKRSLLAFSRKPQTPETDVLTIEIGRHEYTPEYMALTRDFYLKM